MHLVSNKFLLQLFQKSKLNQKDTSLIYLNNFLLNHFFFNYSLLDKIKNTTVIINANVNTTLKISSKKKLLKFHSVLPFHF